MVVVLLVFLCYYVILKEGPRDQSGHVRQRPRWDDRVQTLEAGLFHGSLLRRG